MFLCRLETFIEVLVDSHGWRPCHVRLHLPQQGYTATRLQVARNREAAIGFTARDHVLSLTEVGSATFPIEASYDEPTAHPSSILT